MDYIECIFGAGNKFMTVLEVEIGETIDDKDTGYKNTTEHRMMTVQVNKVTTRYEDILEYEIAHFHKDILDDTGTADNLGDDMAEFQFLIILAVTVQNLVKEVLPDIGLEFGHKVCIKITAGKIEYLDDNPDAKQDDEDRFTLDKVTRFECINDFTIVMGNSSIFQGDGQEDKKVYYV